MITAIWTVLGVSVLGAFMCCKARSATPAVVFALLAAGSVFLLLPSGHDAYMILADIFDGSNPAGAK